MSSKTSSHGDEKPKKIGREIERLAQNDYFNGNDLLYYFCQKYPIPPLENVEEAQEKLTLVEARFADQMWLIGRAYAASPERYSYSCSNSKNDDSSSKDEGSKGKPKEDLLDEEGYESFFQDIARIMLRAECHQEGRPIAYFRGNRVDINKVIDELASPSSDTSIWEDIIDPDNGNANNAKLLDSWIGKRDDDGVSPAKKAAKNAAKKLCELFYDQRLFAQGKPGALEFELVRGVNSLDNEKSIEHNIQSVKDSTLCVSLFAAALNSARRLRDVACILETLVEIKTRLIRAKKKSGEDSTHGNLFDELFPSKEKQKSWRKLPKRADLVAQGEPSESISFSSKFLHFHCPRAFFIYDSISASKTKSSSKKLGKSFKDFKKYKKVFDKKYNNFLKQYKGRYEREYEELLGCEARSIKRGLDYFKHASEELVFAYFLFDHLLDNNQSSNSACNQLITGLRSSTPETQDDLHGPLHYTYITRLVDELVMNSNAT